MRTAARVIFVSIAMLAPLSAFGSETTGEISGHVHYTDGKPVPGIKIWVCSAEQVAVANTDSRGFFSFPALRVIADELTTQDSSVYPIGVHVDLGNERPLQAYTSADVGSFDADDRLTSCSW